MRTAARNDQRTRDFDQVFHSAHDFIAAWERAGRAAAGVDDDPPNLPVASLDLEFETGKPELARAMYRNVENTGSGASMDAKARLAALDAGGVSMTDIKALRTAAGAQCAMCHGR